MYIEFSLPSGAGGIAASFAASTIRKELERWSSKHGIKFTSKIVKYKYRVCFDDDKNYTVFSLSWEGDKYGFLKNFRIISDLNNRT